MYVKVRRPEDTIDSLRSVNKADRGKQYPPIFIAKLDVESAEWAFLTRVMGWLINHPPCYLILEMLREVLPKNKLGDESVNRLLHLLWSAGYTKVWRTESNTRYYPKRKNEKYEWPPSPPYIVASTVTEMKEALKRDRPKTHIRDIIFAQDDIEGCTKATIRRCVSCMR